MKDTKTQPAMDAVIEELRMLAEDLDLNGYSGYSSALLKAADEIECLRAKIAEMERQEPDGWLRVIDEAIVTAHIGVANAHDTYEQAKAKLDNLIGFNVDIATDPAVNGGYKLVPVEPKPEEKL